MKFTAVTVILIAIALVVLGPFLLVWSLNALFGNVGLEIPYSLETWSASIFLHIFFASAFYRK